MKEYKVLNAPGYDGVTRKDDNEFFPPGSLVLLKLEPGDEELLIEMGIIEPAAKVGKEVLDGRNSR